MHKTTVGRVFCMLDAAVQYVALTNPFGSSEKKEAEESDAVSFAQASGVGMRRGDRDELPPGILEMMRNGAK